MTSSGNSSAHTDDAHGHQNSHHLPLASSSKTITKKHSKLKNLTFGISFCANVFFLGVIFCWVILESLRSKDIPGENQPPSALEDDVFYSCSPCSPMMKADDVDMNLKMGNASHVCCRKISTSIKLQVSFYSVLVS